MRTLFRVVLLLLIAVKAAIAQQVVILNTGTQIEGRYDGGNSDTVNFIDEYGNRHKFKIDEIQSLIFNRPHATTSAAAMASPPPPRPPPPPSVDPGAMPPPQAYEDTDTPRGGTWARHAVIPAGAEIAVRTIDPIDVRDADPHRHFLATVVNDVFDADGNVAIPRGAPANLIVHDVGGGDIAVDLRSVSVNGQRYILNSENIIDANLREGLGANKRTGKFVGGGAIVGTVLGAIVGGGKGAAIGALTGGATGAGAEVLTRGHALHIPPETILRFRLDHPVYLYE